MDQKRFAYKNKDIKQDFYNALSSRKDLLNRPHYGPIQPNLKTELNKVSNRVKNFVKKVGNPSRVKIEQGNYFLYDDSNMIDQTFYTELNKKIQTYGLISYFNKDTKNYSDLITPKNNLKFMVQEDKPREDLSLQLQSVTNYLRLKLVFM